MTAKLNRTMPGTQDVNTSVLDKSMRYLKVVNLQPGVWGLQVHSRQWVRRAWLSQDLGESDHLSCFMRYDLIG